MMLKQTYQIFRRNGLRQLLLLIFVLAGLQTMAQSKIQIGGSVYGGGNEGVVGGNTTVTLRAGDLNKVFGGARMANVGGRAFVNIDGAHASNYMLINYVYGGNDISGTIGNSTVPEELIDSLVEQNHIDDSWNAFISMSPTTSTRTVDGVTKKLEIYIGQLFGGGNGAYNYESGAYENLQPPKLGKTYLEIRGGSIVYAFGGGNNATVTGKTVICVDNKSEVVNSIKVENENHQWVELLTDERIKAMGYNPGYTYPTSAAYQIGSFFGGNNVAAMNIRPTWNLKKGKIRNVYSGGNEGDMNSPDGLLLNIDPDKGGVFEVDNVYGGCRKANVIPLDEGGREITVKNLTELDNYGEPYFFPDGLAARTVIRGGHINNVYGGNDISGRVSGGNAIGIRTAIYGDIYGGGNGSYPYTDNPNLVNDPTYGDFYYNPDAILEKAGVTVSDNKLKSVTALNLFRPNTEQVSIRVVGKPNKETIIHGGIFCGGNSATLKNNDPENAMLELKFGSYVIADSVFLGNNGANMVLTNEENREKNIREGVLRTYQRTDLDRVERKEFNSMDLTDSDVFEEYMKAVAMTVTPRVVFDTKKTDGTGEPENYIDYSSAVGSFFCGGNVGSMEKNGKLTIDFSHKLIIYNKVVAGCNSADVPNTQWNAAYSGGLLGNADASGNKMELNLSGLKIRPMRWNTDVFDGTEQLVWNTIKWDKDNLKWINVDAPTSLPANGISTEDDLDRRLTGGNIYGGCYNSGHVNGNVVINLNATVVERDVVFDEVEEDYKGEAIYYDNDTYKITERHSGVILGKQGMDVLGSALSVFGGGKGRDTEIWGNTTVNLNAGYTFQIFGGSEQGVIGKPDDEGDYSFNGKTYKYNPAYSCTVNLKGVNKGVSMRQDKTEGMADCEFIYGGGFEGPIVGNTTINLGNGRIFNSFAGSCNADILGYTETYVGRSGVSANGSDVVGFPFVRDYVYGGNDLGGKILGKKDFSGRVSEDDRGKVYSDAVLTGSAYVEYTQGRLDGIFGGCYGSYDYRDRYFHRYTDESGNATGNFHKPWMDNAIVNFRPTYTSALANDTTNVVGKIFGAGQGIGMDKNVGFRDQDMDKLQERSYVLINVPAAMENYKEMEVFGAGSWSGVGMNATPTEENIRRQTDKTEGTHTLDAYLDAHSTVIDLISGQIGSAYGGSYEEGITRRTLVNVPTASTIVMNNIFGGAYGVSNDVPCDVYEANVEYHGANARVPYVYGGNNAFRRTLYGKVNIDVPVKYVSEQYGLTWSSIYGAGYGEDSWSQYTEINLKAGAEVWEAFGGGYGGRVLNKETVTKWQQELDKNNEEGEATHLPLGLGNYTDNGLENVLVYGNGLGLKTNTNVYINKGALANNYSYGGGYGPTATVSGTTYIGLHGGTVKKDVYGGGWGGSVYNIYNLSSFSATTNAYIEGGTLRKVFGGGYQGSVGYHDTETDATTTDVLGVANVVIGIRKDQTINFNDATLFPDGYGFYKGVPAIQWNAYGAGEGGAVYGTSKLTINNGYIGYYYDEESSDVSSTPFDERYIPKLDDETWKVESERAGRLKDYGNVFGAGYDDKSLSDYTEVTIWGGWIRGSLYGGGEIATVGRGRTNNLTGLDRDIQSIDRAGGTHVEMYNGHVLRHVFGGGKGYNDLGYGGTNELYTDGYVFGQTEVYIHGGEIGTVEGLADGYGNVFGGGDVGYVYGKGYFNNASHNEETGSPNHYYYYAQYKCTGDYTGADGFKYKKDDVINDKSYNALPAGDQEHWQSGKFLTEDCKVVVSPYLQVRPGKSVTYNNHTYGPYEYVPTEYLNTLLSKENDANKWKELFCGDGSETVDPEDKDERGVIIRNAVFAGGNVSSNSEQTYANATTVFGNTTATLFDVYHRDFISVGTEHIGGLYGGGNLSVVDGYRELNITNYGTDYYNLNTQISVQAYRDSLTNRERAYFQLEYLCIKTYTKGDKTYTKDVSRLSEEEYNALTNDDEKANWAQYGFCSIYAGRLLNTIQRAEFCGVFGSRMVLQGAKDRVADIGDNTQYTINRVNELSLNKQRSVINNEADPIHGNYFGIYSVVNYLGNLTSDERFHDNRTIYNNNTHLSEETNITFWDWKKSRLKYRDRNNGTCLNQVALASGVFLELTTEKSTKTKKDYGYITGIIELDLINVKKDAEGGGYVYARNEHRVPRYYPNKLNVVLSEYNKPEGDWACSYKQYRYDSSGTASEWPEDDDVFTVGGDDSKRYQLVEYETSGNFIHRKKRIVDDCYPNNGVYNDYSKSPAHYWYIKGEVYIYDQEVSAYAGSASAYSKEVKLPLTITAGSNGKLQLINVQPNRYAYYKDANHNKIDANGVKVDNESMTYYLNDVITWWDWHQLPESEQAFFVEETYVNVDTCYVNGTLYPEGTYAMLPGDRATFLNNNTLLNKKGEAVTDVNTLFHTSNNIGHDTGYVVTFDMDSPADWNDWYSPKTGASTIGSTRKTKAEYQALSSSDQANYREGPTYTLKNDDNIKSGLYGQRRYKVSEIIPSDIVEEYKTTTDAAIAAGGWTIPEDQAQVKPAYVALSATPTIQAGTGISETDYNALPSSDKRNFAPAKVCLNTIRLSDSEYILQGELVPSTMLEEYAQRYMDYNNSQANMDPIANLEDALEYIKSRVSDAYYCTREGLYGGQYFNKGENYNALKAWCALTDDRTKFDFNYDAFDVLSDPTYPGEGHTNVYRSPYCDEKPVEYTAAYLGTGTYSYWLEGENESTDAAHTITSASAPLTREQFEQIKNERRHYTMIEVPQGSDTYTTYIAQKNFTNKGTPYAKGKELSASEYASLTPENKTETVVKTVAFQKDANHEQIWYYCYEAYGNVSEGTRINSDAYRDDLKNYQDKFTIQGMEPTGTITLYVSRESNAKDVTAEKVITVVYQYSYYEDEDEGDGVSLVNELHVVNIHLKLESGVPEIGPLTAPSIVLPGSKLALKAPSVNPGLYEIISNGWEMYDTEEDALMHRNGKPFTNNSTPVYWYQNQNMWVAFYSRTYLGYTYSDPVIVSVANYHDLHDVMADTENHMHIDHACLREPKIYIDQTKYPEENQLDLLKSLFDLSAGSVVEGHTPVDVTIRDCRNLEFILQSDLSHTNSWTSLGDASHCFEATLHGDGHTISGLDHSLFGKLCGEVYNLGVTGSFTTSGIADAGTGYLENCWVKKDEGTVNANTMALFESPTNTETRTVHLVNCYYPKENGFTSQSGATEKPLQAFYNGEVAYDLNGFYLFKRYCDHQDLSTNGYKYQQEDQNGVLQLKDGYYESQAGPYLLNDKEGHYVGCYVENRYADGDFIYANGTLPETTDIRYRTVTTGTGENAVTTTYIAPIWPDDYLFFGQALNYGQVQGYTHDSQPSSIKKGSDTRLLTTVDGNRVYRAPAYFGNSEKKVAHFNPYAVFARTDKTNANIVGFKGMTAIDFTGYGDGAYAYSLSDGQFYPPLLDDDGLTRFVNVDLTKNLLVYTGTSTTAAAKTDAVVSSYLHDYEYVEMNSYYHNVEEVELLSNTFNGHWVQKVGDDYVAQRDHLLVDKPGVINDFNAPIAYHFADGKRMWYERMPDNYVTLDVTTGKTKGWEGFCLPFNVEIVTTPDKGELTHFYNFEDNSMGHEYWLREFTGANGMVEDNLQANFTYPGAGTTDKTYTNTFLWDYYYSWNEYDDKNRDHYQDIYYKGNENHLVNTYYYYPRSQAGKPYLAGFPGETYYEFDLSGSFDAKNRNALNNLPDHPAPAKLDKQTMIFASAPGAFIGVSDKELASVKVTNGGNNYFYCPTYASKELPVDSFMLSSDGSRYQRLTEPATVKAFRPYFVKTVAPSPTTPTRGESTLVNSIIFSNETSTMSATVLQPTNREENLLVKAARKKIIVESQLHKDADVRIVTPAGITLNAYIIEPGETVVTRVENGGVYIVYAADGQYVKKLIVK